jgi:hypothetical protein
MSDNHSHDEKHDEVAHEKTDVNLSGIVIVAVVSVVILITSLILLDDIFVLWVERDKQEYVYGVPSAELNTIRSKASEKLNRYAVLDADKGVYQLPIERAMKLIADEAYSKRGK